MTPTEGQPPLPSPDPEEIDPTGIRDLLRSLPDPGPMPEDLVDRISARLSAEQAQRRDGGHRDEDPRPVADLADRRSRRRPARSLAYLGVAAAGLLVATVAVGELVGDGLLGPTAGLDGVAQVSTHSRGGSDTGGARAAAADDQDEAMADAAGGAQEDSATEEGADEAGGADDGQAHDQAGDGESAGELARPAVELLGPLGRLSATTVRADVLAALSLATGAPASTTTLTPSGAEHCWQAAGGTADWPVRQAAEAVYEGVPVVVLVGRDGDAGEAVLLPRSCTGDASVEPLETLAWDR